MGYLRFLLVGSVLVLSACDSSDGIQESENRAKSKALASQALLENADKDASNWLTHGRTYDEQRYSPLDQINVDSVKNLGLACYYDLDTKRGQEATPIIVDGVMYTTSAWSKVQAFNAKTGELLWQFDPEVAGEYAAKGCCDVVNRGVAYWDGKVYVGAFDGRLIALDADTGQRVWSTDTIEDRSVNYTITGAPRVVKGKVLIGNGGGEYGVRGYVSAYDADTGEKVWRFYTVPGNPAKPQENAIHNETVKTWTGEWWKLGGGGTAWDSMAYDPDLDLLYIGVGNGSPWNPEIRSPEGGDNLFLSSIVAVRPDTGKYVWHFQTTPGDQWDFTATQHMILADLEIEGQIRKVIMQAPKNGYFYVLDRSTGEFISGEPFANVTWSNGLDPKTGRPDIVPEAFYHVTGKPFLGSPGPMGAHSWHPMSFNPETGLVYFAAQELAFPYISDKNFTVSNKKVNLGVDLKPIGLPSDQPTRTAIRKSLQGRLSAWDPVSGEEVWRVDHGGPWNGGTLSTAGGLVFQGDRNDQFAAYDAKSGDKLWSADAQTGVVAAPVSFSVDGEQYVAIVAGWGGIVPLLLGEMSHRDDGPIRNKSRVLVYKIGGTEELPAKTEVFQQKLDPPEAFGSDEDVVLGSGIYADYCSSCHGDTAVSGGVIPDLRYSYAIQDQEDWDEIVLKGALTDNGMIGFESEFDNETSAAIRAYVVKRAHEGKQAE